ncbi:uncharacterized protein ATNIH1004_002964 [Aspergillus tanneri]|uniref:Uncharacterized protein n=1 Tax=Aspergillus tanneri TaxID=1220188 RepID=A0A5M9MT21_9EURO|nr:uncharacterized protein ATNIH1004_002964 [Aspergillus tanneri]KAA8650282.1 hypothetical protein ATNIH1004_002964 [Aspergillus tanneri]
MAYSSPCLLSEILNLYPKEDNHCVGYAHTKGRQCRNVINKENRNYACGLLERCTRRFCAGQRIDNLLDELAPLVLCKRFHQYQASDLSSNWRLQICKFQATQIRVAAAASPARRSAPVEDRMAQRHMRPETPRMTRSRETSSDQQSRQSQSSSSPSQTQRRRESPSIRPRTGASIDTDRTARISTDQEESTSTVSSRQRFSETTSAIETESGSTRNTSTASTTTHATRSVTPVQTLTTRRCVEGNCSICMQSMQEQGQSHINQPSTGNEEDEEEDREVWYETNSDTPDPDSEASSESEQQDDIPDDDEHNKELNKI